ncbi:hypothetical protein KC19_VG031700 [Ceratodon purpureus]|uniref:Uncharacterized protein n=1 Tax=Ceratodon purpureus TaxID=3225 RepID=A0A8T0HLF1_CERPU|nr:hypothetical protein KC19_VG031700 [Ceratodon purpureus]
MLLQVRTQILSVPLVSCLSSLLAWDMSQIRFPYTVDECEVAEGNVQSNYGSTIRVN